MILFKYDRQKKCVRGVTHGAFPTYDQDDEVICAHTHFNTPREARERELGNIRTEMHLAEVRVNKAIEALAVAVEAAASSRAVCNEFLRYNHE